MFDRTTNFRECNDLIKLLKEDFPGTPLLFFTVTLSYQQLYKLCTNHLHKPALFNSSMNKKNIKINNEKYKIGSGRSRSVVTHGFMDFKNDTKLMIESLKNAGIPLQSKSIIKLSNYKLVQSENQTNSSST